MPSCIHTSLLRLQEILLAKLAVTGLVLPGTSIAVLPLLPSVSSSLTVSEYGFVYGSNG